MRLLQAFILAVSVASVARAGFSYLPLTGPPALRILAVRTPKTVPVAILAPTPVALVTNADDCTNVAAVANDAGPLLPPVNLGAANPVDSAPGTPGFVLPAQDMLGMTPEMVAAYFQPVAVGTNGVALPVQFRVGFIPPLADPDKSSHAEYIVK